MQAGQYGFRLDFDAGMPLAGVTTMQLSIKPPRGSVIRRVIPLGNIVSEPAGTFFYMVAAGDFIEPGEYQLQLFLQWVDKGWVSEPAKVRVYPNIDTLPW